MMKIIRPPSVLEIFRDIPPIRQYLVYLSGKIELAKHIEQKCLVESVPCVSRSNTGVPSAGLS